MAPTLDEEWALVAQGFGCIAGVDEVGRGCWAGPVVAAAVVLGPDVLVCPRLLEGVDDSKQLTAGQRQRFSAQVHALAQAVGIGAVPAFLIDCIGIADATRLAMQLALLALPCIPDALLIDAVRLPMLAQPQRVLVRGDARSLSIAAASVVAKVARDRYMHEVEANRPVYGFAAHKGYGTAAHYRALRRYGPGAFHRRSFRPIAAYLETGSWPERAGIPDSEE